MPREGFVAALVVVLALLAVVQGEAALDRAVKPEREIVGPNETVTLSPEGGEATVRIKPVDGWGEDPGRSSDQLKLHRGGVKMSFQLFSGVKSLRTLVDRYKRFAEDVSIGDPERFDAGAPGISGLRAHAAGQGLQGHVIALGKGGVAVVILALSPPGTAREYEDQVERTIESVRIGQ